MLESITWYKVIDEWYIHNVEGILKPATIRSYNLAIRQIKERMPNCDVTEIDELMLQELLNGMAANSYSKSSINKIKIVMNSAVHYALLHHYLDANPIYRLSIPKNAYEGRVEALSIEEQTVIEEYCKTRNNLKDKATLFLLNTGLRASELYNLKWEDYHRYNQSSYIFISKSKTENGKRIVPLNSAAQNIINQLPQNLGEYVFTYNCGQLSETIMSDHNRHIRTATGISPFTNHICRHTFATRALEKGMNPKALSKILGHSSVAFTMSRYTTISKDFIFEQMKLIDF